MVRQYELVEKVKEYDPGVDESLLNRAYVFAMKAHGKQKRASGDAYFSHPLEVAGILTDMRLDSDTIATALLHDVVEDTIATIDEIRELFGPKVAELVDGVTKLSKIELQTENIRQAENFRKFLLAMSNDIRVLLVKLADRLHNMRTIKYIKNPDKRRRIAIETMEIYAPLAERIGMHEMKDELEHISFTEMDPEAFESIVARLTYMVEESPTLEKDMTDAVMAVLKEHNIKGRVSGRIKRPYSIWRKMERNDITFEQLSDVMAFRIIVPDIETCYRLLGIIHQKWPCVPGRFKDYISIPKRNFYRSIHTTVLGPHNGRLEIQFRTERMNREAEYGVAAHWEYKQADKKIMSEQYRWMQELLEILDEAESPEEFLKHTKLNMFQDQVFCFTPKGELISLPQGSTPVDFAYQVHTEIGERCVGSKVNGRMVPLRHQLMNGDQVEILTSQSQKPSPRWESFVVTGKARSAIRRYARHRETEEYNELGKTLLEKACRRNGLDFTSQVVIEAAKVMNIETADMLYTLVGQGALDEQEVLLSAFPGYEGKSADQGLPMVHSEWEKAGIAGELSLPIAGLRRGVTVHLSDCCYPVRGDRIVGIRTPGKGVEVHTIDCGQLDAYHETPDIWMDISWDPSEEDLAYYTGRLRLDVINEIGALASIVASVAKRGANISNVTITERDPEFYVMIVEVEVKDVKHLSDIARALRVNRVIASVDRVAG